VDLKFENSFFGEKERFNKIGGFSPFLTFYISIIIEN